MTHVFTKDPTWLKKWDDFISKTPRGNHLLLSDWLNSYTTYGFDFELCIFLEDETIIGGYGAVIAKALFFKFYIVPHGPVFSKGFEKEIPSCLDLLKQRAKKHNCCYTQFSLPISSHPSIQEHVYHPTKVAVPESQFRAGKLFDHVYCSYGINWIDFNDCNTSEEFINQLPAKTRRNIRLAYRLEVENTLVTYESELKAGYSIVEANALQGNYALRSYEDIKAQLLSLMSKDKGYFMILRHDNQIKGASFSIQAGNYITNIFGGTKKGKPDIKAGYVLHWEWILKSFELGFSGYNISMGGSKGVREFKAHFGAQEIFYETPHYYRILNPFIFKFYKKSYGILKNNKTFISGILKRFK
ncbi:lipid II:glycine glycyltransferase FemX [Formosa maritima]|uniref:Aminoacyltransferase n=1 Tax=Formosa maritima TaxID=2592046 RepID=A0A5D0GCA3_9FLAO|nr:GNAT family N-acetyltransferase [Formosa maritima]TYA56648.1 aminoacyltransferase [Formosa maritima]